ncbi:Omega-crystallin [Arthrobotrys entomopaga]|nr:Omega-crystallin [Arthrobotrys entomopaga]
MSELNWNSFSNIIDGKLVNTSETRYSVNPSTGQPNLPVPVSTKDDLDAAVKSARKAFKTWSVTPWDERKNSLLEFGKAIVAEKEGFAKLLVEEQGKPLAFALREVFGAEFTIKTLCSLKLEDEVIQEEGGRTVTKRYLPIGVGGGIIPWNYPIGLMIVKVTHSVLTGNTIICKPSPFTPYTGLKLAELAQRFFPPGVVNCLSGDDNLGPWMTSHPGIDKISFTGSSATGRKVMESCSRTLKRVTLELGGKDPAIILPDVDIPLVASQIAVYAFFNSGQICVAAKRVYVHSSIAKEFIAALVEATKNLKVGDGMEEGVFMGPLNNSMQYEKVLSFAEDIEHEGGQIVLGGDKDNKFRYRGRGSGNENGYFIDPMIVVSSTDDSRIMKEEPFGPILPVATWEDDEEVIARANDTDLGLGASVWGNDMARVEKIARRLEAGSVWINEHVLTSPVAPFGGWKGSGVGVENGREGLAGWCNVQSLYIRKEVKSLL